MFMYYELLAQIHVGWVLCLMGLVVYEWVHLTEHLASGAGGPRDLSSTAFDSPVCNETRLEPVHTPAHDNAETPPNTHTYNTEKCRQNKQLIDSYAG